MVKTSKITTKKLENSLVRRVINADNYSELEQQGIIKLYQALVPGDDKRQIDVQMIITEGFPKFEETIGKEEFAKLKKYFGLSNEKSRKIKDQEAKSLIARLRTVENAQYYIVEYKKLVQNVASKLLNTPAEMSDLVKAKMIRMFFIVLANHEIFLEDYSYKAINGKYQIVFDEAKALANNKRVFGPEELFEIYSMKVAFSEGYYYDMMIMFIKNMYQESHIRRYKKELSELLEFSELTYDGETFESLNQCMPGVSFGQVRNLKKRIHKVNPVYPLEMFCGKKVIADKIDFTDLYIVYKTLNLFENWEVEEKKRVRTYRSMSGSRFIDQEQVYYEVFDNFVIADKAEAERWIALFRYVIKHEIQLKTKFDGEGNALTSTESYNAGTFGGVLRYSMEIGYINKFTRVLWDFAIAKNLLSFEGAEEIFLKFKRDEISFDEVREYLDIDEEYEKNVLHVELLDQNNVFEGENEKVTDEVEDVEEEHHADEKQDDISLVDIIIKFALDNNYMSSKEDIDVSLIENIFIPGNEQLIKKFYTGEIKVEDFKKKLSFEEDFAEAYFNLSQVDIKAIETRLQDIKKSVDKSKVRRNKLLILLYCYIIKNGIGCGPKNKVPKRNKGLKPEILESLVA